MSKFFDDVSDSSDEETVTSDEQSDVESDDMGDGISVDDEYSEINPKWLIGYSDDEDSDEEDTVILSRDAKAVKEIADLSDQMDMWNGNNKFSKGYSLFNELKKKAEDYAARKGGYRPEPFLAALNLLKETVSTPPEREECETKEDFSKFNQLKKLSDECQETYKLDLERQARIDAGEEKPVEEPQGEEEPKGEDWSREGMLEKFGNLHKLKQKAQNRILRGIISHSKQLNLPSFEIAATSQLASNTLNEDGHLMTHIPLKQWKSAFDLSVKAFDLASSNNFNIIEGLSSEKMENEKNTTVFSFSAQAEDLYWRFTQACQFEHNNIDVIRPKVEHEQPLLEHCVKLLKFYENRGTRKAVMNMAIIIEDIIHTRRPEHHEGLCDLFKTDAARGHEQLFSKVHTIILDNVREAEDQYTISILRQAYNLAGRDEFYQARDLILQADLANVEYVTPALKVANNRVFAQLGLCAFRNSLFNEANTILSELVARPIQQVRILLGQDIAFVRDNAAKELKYRSRLVPLHRHMNAELIEGVALVCAMIVAVVADAKKPFDRSNKPTYLAKLFTQQSMQLLQGAPANLKDSIYQCSRVIEKASLTMFVNNANGKLPIFDNRKEWTYLGSKEHDVLEALEREFKIASLKIFLINEGAKFLSLSVPTQLVPKFDLDESTIRSYINQLLLDREKIIVGYWDSKNEGGEEYLYIQAGAPSKLHHLAELFADRLTQLAGTASNTRGDRRGGKRNYSSRITK